MKLGVMGDLLSKNDQKLKAMEIEFDLLKLNEEQSRHEAEL